MPVATARRKASAASGLRCSASREIPRPTQDEPLSGTARSQAGRIAEGVEDIRASGRLRRVPAVFVTGRSDGILPPNFASRAYFGLNNMVDGSTSSLRYYEVTNAQHLGQGGLCLRSDRAQRFERVPGVSFRLNLQAYGSLVLGVSFENLGCEKWDVGRLAG